jgi:hypothetical protein
MIRRIGILAGNRRDHSARWPFRHIPSSVATPLLATGASAFFNDSTASPIFFVTFPLMNPRMLWFCQSVAFAIRPSSRLLSGARVRG